MTEEDLKPLKDSLPDEGEEETKDQATQKSMLDGIWSPEDVGNFISRNMLFPVKPKLKEGRNDSCPCGSKRKFKRCCWDARHG